MKLVSLALIVLFGRANSSSVNCIENCKEIRNDLLSEPHICNPALTIAPLPDVYKSCQTGKKAAFDKACVPLCNGEETTTASLTSSASIACRSNRGRGPSDYWCKRGFSSILKKLEGYSFPSVEEAIIEETEYEAVMSSDDEEESLEEEPEESKDEGLEKEPEDPNEENLEKGLDESEDEGLEVEVEDPVDENLKEEPEESQDESPKEEEVDEATDATAEQDPGAEIVGEVEYAEANEF